MGKQRGRPRAETLKDPSEKTKVDETDEDFIESGNLRHYTFFFLRNEARTEMFGTTFHHMIRDDETKHSLRVSEFVMLKKKTVNPIGVIIGIHISENERVILLFYNEDTRWFDACFFEDVERLPIDPCPASLREEINRSLEKLDEDELALILKPLLEQHTEDPECLIPEDPVSLRVDPNSERNSIDDDELGSFMNMDDQEKQDLDLQAQADDNELLDHPNISDQPEQKNNPEDRFIPEPRRSLRPRKHQGETPPTPQSKHDSLNKNNTRATPSREYRRNFTPFCKTKSSHPQPR